LFLAATAFAASAGAEAPAKIQDNSFLLEEAYNQEPGVVQHIQAFQYLTKDKTWTASFTEEWPWKGQKNQLSVTLPVEHFPAPGNDTGLGDVGLNYRYQALLDDRVAASPRVTLLLPTGDEEDGFGAGALGYQVNMPFSVDLSDRWVTHWNFGATYTPDSRAAGSVRADTLGFNAGFSVIHVLSDRLNLMMETAATSEETPLPAGGTERNDTFFLNPGVRGALNFESGLQVVPGLAFPIGVGPSDGEHGVFLYLSFEHPLRSGG